MISPPVRITKSLISPAIVTPFRNMPQIASAGDFLFDDGCTALLDDGYAIRFTMTN